MKRNGFTLVEVLVVIAIIAIIGFGAVSIAQSVHERANVNKTQTILRTLNAALEEYYRDTKSYPASGIANLYDALSKNPKTSALIAGLPSDCVQPVAGGVVIYDGWHTSEEGDTLRLDYIDRKNGNFPQIRSAGTDRTFNTSDDIVSTEL